MSFRAQRGRARRQTFCAADEHSISRFRAQRGRARRQTQRSQHRSKPHEFQSAAGPRETPN